MKLVDRLKKLNKNKKVKSSKILKKKQHFFKDKLCELKKFYNDKIERNKNAFSIKEVVFVMLITFLFGMLIGGVIMFGRGTFNRGVGKSLNEFVDTYEDILNTYYEDLDAVELLQAGIEGMVDYLGDPYASYMNAIEASDFNEEVEGEYSGIGAEISYNYSTGLATFGEIFEDGPAYKAGVLTGDILLAVNDESVEGKDASAIASIVKGETGTDVCLKVKREDKELEFTIKRGMVDIESVETEIYEENDKKIGYISISIFAHNTYDQFSKKLEALEKEGFDSLLIDVRGNSGGYLTTVTDIISMFMKKGSVIYQLSTKGDVEKVKDKTKESRNYPVYVLTNGSSASASEVLTAAFKENYGATILGTKTYGKGKVQKAYSLSNGAKIKYTFQEWLTPDGNTIDSVGIEPNIVIEQVISVTGNDIQLANAINEITK